MLNLNELLKAKYSYSRNLTREEIAGPLSAKKMGKVLFSGQKYQTCRDGWEGSEKRYF